MSDYSDELQSVVMHLHDAEGDAIGMSGAASFLFRFLEFFIAVSMANETPSDYLQKRNAVLLFGSPWSAFGIARVHALLCCIIHVHDHLLTLGGDAEDVNRGSAFLSGVFPCLAHFGKVGPQGVGTP